MEGGGLVVVERREGIRFRSVGWEIEKGMSAAPSVPGLSHSEQASFGVSLFAARGVQKRVPIYACVLHTAPADMFRIIELLVATCIAPSNPGTKISDASYTFLLLVSSITLPFPKLNRVFREECDESLHFET
jgi:hypothetical protein